MLINKDLEQTNIMIAFETCSYIDIKDFYTAQMLSIILGGGSSSRLFQSIRENLGLAYSIGSYVSGYSDCGLFSVYVACNHDKVPIVIDSLKKEFVKIINNITDYEKQKAINQIKTSLYMAEEKSSFKSESIGKNYMIFGKYIGIEEISKIIDSITNLDITNCAKKIFSTQPSVVVLGKFSANIYDRYKKIIEEFAL